MVKYKQYILDRCDGNSYGDDIQEIIPNCSNARPPIFFCWVPPCVKWCPGFLEQNSVIPCKAFGRVGCTKSQNDDSFSVRRKVFTVALISNIIGMILTIVACVSIATDFDMLRRISFSEGQVSQLGSTGDSIMIEPIEISIGLRAVASRNPNREIVDQVTYFDDFCDLLGEGLERYVDDNQCNSCKESSQSYVASVISSVVLYFPSIFTDVLRMYPTYDVNCQKFYGSIVALISIVLTMYTLLNYTNACFEAFYDSQVPFFAGNFTPVPANYNGPEPIVIMEFDWEGGNGLICLTAATALKLVDVICNLIVPVPSIARDLDEQKEYELKYGQSNQENEHELKLDEKDP